MGWAAGDRGLKRAEAAGGEAEGMGMSGEPNSKPLTLKAGWAAGERGLKCAEAGGGEAEGMGTSGEPNLKP